MNTPISDEVQAKTQAQGIARPAWLLRIEGATLLIGAVWVYAIYSGNWLLFALLLLAPDLSALGYLAGVRLGATTYNLAHTLIWPAILAALAFSQSNVFLHRASAHLVCPHRHGPHARLRPQIPHSLQRHSPEPCLASF